MGTRLVIAPRFLQVEATSNVIIRTSDGFRQSADISGTIIEGPLLYVERCLQAGTSCCGDVCGTVMAPP